jgi:hypothetical protein
MPIEYEIDARRRLIRTSCVGPVTLADVIAHFRTLETDPKAPDQLDVLLDFSELTAFPDSHQVRSVALEIRDLLPKIAWRHCAIVGPRDVAFGIGRMFEMISEPYFRATTVFRSAADAEQWLRTRGGPEERNA